jgi:hypothetical protein
MIEMKEYLRKLLKGEVSLFIVFWFWFVGIYFFIEIFFQIEFSENSIINNNYSNIFLFLVILIYSILIFIIIYKSSNNYKGTKIWAFLAKIILTINLFLSFSYFIDIVKFYFAEDYTIEKEIADFRSNLPIKVNSTSILTDIYKKDKTIFYSYQLLEVAVEKNIDINRFKKQIQSSLCEDNSSLDLLKRDYILDYEYTNEKEESIISVKTVKENCGKGIYDLEILNEVLQRQGML